MDNDQRIIELLGLLAHYDLLLEQLEKSMRDGFQNLGRANYHNKDTLRGRYGSDYWDESYEGQVCVNISDCDRVRISNLKSKSNSEEISCEKEKDDERHEDAHLRKRNQEDKEKKLKKLRNRDPLLMFGGFLSIPGSLRQCQTNFKGVIPLLEELINCKRDITKLADRIENNEIAT